MAKSALLFCQGLLRHFWTLVPGGLLGAIELIQRGTGESVEMPPWVFWLALGGGLLLAAFLAFHDLRTGLSGDTPDNDLSDFRRDAISDLLGQSLTIGIELSDEGVRPPLEGWKAHTRTLVAAAYGDGEAAHIFTPELKGSKVYRGKDAVFARMEMPPPMAEEINNLKMLLGRMHALTIRSDFDPADWRVFDPGAFKAKHSRSVGKAKDEEHWTCPWCRLETNDQSWSSSCDNCGARKRGDAVYEAVDLVV